MPTTKALTAFAILALSIVVAAAPIDLPNRSVSTRPKFEAPEVIPATTEEGLQQIGNSDDETQVSQPQNSSGLDTSDTHPTGEDIPRPEHQWSV